MVCTFYFARCINIIFNSLAQLVKYDVHTTRKIKFIHATVITYCYFTQINSIKSFSNIFIAFPTALQNL